MTDKQHSYKVICSVTVQQSIDKIMMYEIMRNGWGVRYIVTFIFCIFLSQVVMASKADKGDVVATINDRKIYLSEVDAYLDEQIYEIKVELYNLRKKALDMLILDYALEIGAKENNLSEEEYLSNIVKDIKLSLSDDLISAMTLNIFDGDISQDDEELQNEIRNELIESASELRLARHVEKLKNNGNIQISLDKPVYSKKIYELGNEDLISFGSTNAPVVVHYYYDYDCNYCLMSLSSLRDIVNEYSDHVRLVFRYADSNISSQLHDTNMALMCAKENGKFWDYIENLFSQFNTNINEVELTGIAESVGLDKSAWKTCYEKYHNQFVDYDYKNDIIEGLSIVGTPTYFINGYKRVGLLSYDEMSELIDDANK